MAASDCLVVWVPDDGGRFLRTTPHHSWWVKLEEQATRYPTAEAAAADLRRCWGKLVSRAEIRIAAETKACDAS